jgi:dTDP-4-amino-4,6-dideoxygalactose transaminase
MAQALTHIPFNKPLAHGAELDAIGDAIANAHLSADGPYSTRCRELLREQTGAAEVMLTHSCTAALEVSALLAGVGPGDEVIMPSFTFVTTASAFALRGARPVFVDIRPDTLNVDPDLIAAAISEETKAIVPVHYAGIACEMEPILELAADRGIPVIEDAAQGLMSSWRSQALGAIGELGAISFHETKNVTCGEGGALLINDPELIEKAQIIRDKGTNRASFMAGEAERYTWVDLGSSYGLSDLNAAFLWEQLLRAREVTDSRLTTWNTYHSAFEELEERGVVRRPVVPDDATHNAHLYYLLVDSPELRTDLLARMNEAGVNSVFHYVPLHSSPAGRRFARVDGEMTHTDDLAARLVRLPLWAGMDEQTVERIVEVVHDCVATADRA